MLTSPRRFIARRGGRTNPKEPKYYPLYMFALEEFKVYLNSHDYFTVKFPDLVRYRWSETSDKTNNDGIVDDPSFEHTVMFQTMAATWVATWECGVSQKDMLKPGIIGTLYRFHVYFTIQHILRSRGRLAFYAKDANVISNVWKYLPTKYRLCDYRKGRVCKLGEITDRDYLSMVAPTTKGLTRLGIQLFQQSVLTFVYALLAAQVINAGKNIIGTNGIALILQKSFVDKVMDRIKADNGVDNILDLYNRTIVHNTATGTITVHQNITPVPSNLKIIQKRPTVALPVEKEEEDDVVIKPFKSTAPIVIGVGIGTFILTKLFS